MKAQATIAIAGGVLLVGVLLYVWQKGLAGVAKSAGKAAGDLVGGGVVGLGEAIGIPETNMNECQKALAEGRYWDASFACPAGTFVKGLFGDTPTVIAPQPNAPAASTGSAAPSSFTPGADLGFV